MSERVFTQTACGVGAIIEQEGKILLVREGGGVDKGKWNLPAGWVEVEKDPLEEIKKEVQEETGYEFEATGLIGIYSIVKYYPKEQIGRIRHSMLLIFRGKITGGSLMEGSDEISEVGWFEPEQLAKMKNKNELRDPDILKRVSDYFAGRNFPLDIISHTIQK